MSTKKQKIELFHKLPLDCWGNVITFLSTPRDFISLLLVVKGLFDYTKNYAPQCTENVKFTLLKIPSHQALYVSQVTFEQEEIKEESFLKERTIQPPEFINVVFEKFPNLLILDMRFAEHDIENPNIAVPVFWKECQTHRSLRIIDISLQVVPILNPPPLPNVRVVAIRRTCERSSLSSTFEDEDLSCSSDCWKNFPNLRQLFLCLLKLDGSVLNDDLKESELHVLQLSHIKNRHSVSGFKNLESLFVKGLSIACLDKIENCNKLKLLEVDDYFNSPMNRIDVASIPFGFEIKNLPSLEYLDIQLGVPSTYQFNGGIMDLRGLPKLECISLKAQGVKDDDENMWGRSGLEYGDLFPVRIYTSSIKEIQSTDWQNKVEIDPIFVKRIKPNDVSFVSHKNVRIPEYLRNAIFPPDSKKVDEGMVKNFKGLTILKETVNLRHVQAEGEDIREYLMSRKPLSFRDFNKLESICMIGDLTKEITCCPSLKMLRFIPSFEFQISANSLPNLELIAFGAISKEHLKKSFQHMTERVLPQCPKLKKLIIFPCYVVHIQIRGDNIPEDSSLQSFSLFCDEGQFVETLDVQNLFSITTFNTYNHSSFPRITKLKNMPKLKGLGLELSGKILPAERRIGSRLIVENMESLESVFINAGLVSVERFRFRTCPNLKSITLSLSMLQPGDEELRFKLSLTDDDFPFVEAIGIHDVESMNGPALRIGLMKDLKCLREIFVMSGVRFNFESIIKETEGIDLKKVTIKSPFFLKEVEGDKFSSKLLKLTLEEYFQHVKKMRFTVLQSQ